MDAIVSLQAGILRTLSSPRRLEIVHRLAEGPLEVNVLAEELGMTQPNVSQHLAVLRAAGLVEAERDGRGVRYRLSDPEIMSACDIMRGVLQRRHVRLAAAILASEPDTAGGHQPIEQSSAVEAAPGAGDGRQD
jgi:DNA-binding transcriptional ArsR family regulator